MIKKYSLSILLSFLVISHAFCKNKPPTVFSTWEGFEVDKCASIWLIKSFINKDAKIKFFPKGTFIKEGIPFDTPNAILRRYHNMSTFEAIMNQYNLNDPNLNYIAKIIHDIEINLWEKKLMPETHKIKNAIKDIIISSKDNDSIIKNSLIIFDLLYKGVF